jgi:hypothetical protein
MKDSPRLLPGWIARLPAALVFGSVVLRAGLTYRGSPEFIPVLAALGGWLALAALGNGFASSGRGRASLQPQERVEGDRPGAEEDQRQGLSE